jgi:hypothetical protein
MVGNCFMFVSVPLQHLNSLFHVCVCSTPASEFSVSCLCLFHASTWILCFMFVSFPLQHLNSLFHVCVFSTPAPEFSVSCMCLFHASTWILCFMCVSFPLQHLTSLFHVCFCSMPAPEFSASCLCLFHARTWTINVICRSFIVFSESRWKEIVRFVDIVWISSHNYLSYLSISRVGSRGAHPVRGLPLPLKLEKIWFFLA